MRPRKRFGQHFLHDPAVIERIVAAIAPITAMRWSRSGLGRERSPSCSCMASIAWTSSK
jgi:hypothetical protein